MRILTRLKKRKINFTEKRCPECYIPMPLDSEKCPRCNLKVGKVDNRGLARKPVNWLSYVVCVVSWAAFVVYLWWAFFKQ